MVFDWTSGYIRTNAGGGDHGRAFANVQGEPVLVVHFWDASTQRRLMLIRALDR